MPIPKNFSRNDTICAFYLRGAKCLEAADIIFQKDPTMPHEILLIHGIELILTAFIMFKDPAANERSVYNLYHHKYKNLFAQCKVLDTTAT